MIDPEVSFLLGKDTNTFRDTLQGLLEGSESLRIARVGDAELRGKLGELQSAFKEYQRAVSEHPRQPAAAGERQARDVRPVQRQRSAAAGRRAAERRLRGRARGPAHQPDRRWSSSRCSRLGVLLLIGKVLPRRLRGAAPTRASRSTPTTRRRFSACSTRSATLGDGDLTVHAKVTEHITGAIADSINYAIDEMRRLVTGITEASTQVTSATAGSAVGVDRGCSKRRRSRRSRSRARAAR